MKTIYETFEGRCASQNYDYEQYYALAKEENIQPLSEYGYSVYCSLLKVELQDDWLRKQLH